MPGFPLRRRTLRSAGSGVPLVPANGKIELRVLLERLSLERFGNDGAVAITDVIRQTNATPHLKLSATGGNVALERIEVHALSSIWE